MPIFATAGGHGLLNIEGFIALGFLAILLVRSRAGETIARDFLPNRYPAVFVALCCTVVVIYWPILNAPFDYDDYTHIADAQQSDLTLALSSFGPVAHKPGLFFRPFGFLVYWLNYLVAGSNPRWWHATSMAFHALDSCLFFVLSRQLRLSWIGSLGAALLFALNATSTEAVAWIDARFDPMATGLALASLLYVCRFLDSGRRVWMMAASIAGACAMLSKESGFSVPLLVACLWFFRTTEDDRRRLVPAFGWMAAVSATLFVYRWWALGGIGGYRAVFSPLKTLEGVFIRDWTIMFFPVNWSSRPGWLLACLILTAPLLLFACAWSARLPRRIYLGCIALTTVAAFPVQHLLLIGSDLSGARILYMLSLGWVILWGAVFSAIPSSRLRTLAIVWILTWHAVMLHHNLAFWLQVPQQAREVCAEFGRTLAKIQTQAVVSGLPQKKNGVTFLANGFPQCVAMNSDVPASRVSVNGEPNFEWNETTERIEAISERK